MKSPGHIEQPQHKVREQRSEETLRVLVDGNVLARSQDVIVVDEDEHRKRYYFPRADVDLVQLEQSEKTTKCPFKGTARYYSIRRKGPALENAVWTYEDPYEEHAALTNRFAFYDELDEIQIERESA